MPDFSEFETFLLKYFPDELTQGQMAQFRQAFNLYLDWNARINVISRTDIQNLGIRHFLHSLSIAKMIRFTPGTEVMDVGTGGGFPGIPLAIFFPEVTFHLVDSIGKKMRVVVEVANGVGLKNVRTSVARVEDIKHQTDFVVSRAVTRLHEMADWVRPRVRCRAGNALPNGILYLKGGDVAEELSEVEGLKGPPQVVPLRQWFEEPFFESKGIVYLPLCK
jgi:16S rRNA (guanine527-N7)-methyltransferase